MMIVMKPTATEAEIQAVIAADRVRRRQAHTLAAARR